MVWKNNDEIHSDMHFHEPEISENYINKWRKISKTYGSHI